MVRTRPEGAMRMPEPVRSVPRVAAERALPSALVRTTTTAPAASSRLR